METGPSEKEKKLYYQKSSKSFNTVNKMETFKCSTIGDSKVKQVEMCAVDLKSLLFVKKNSIKLTIAGTFPPRPLLAVLDGVHSL